MNELTAMSGFDESRLERDNYTLSLSAEALRCGFCTAAQHDAVQAQALDLLAERILLYTDGQSTSVKNDTALQLFRSILYCCDLSMMKEPVENAAKRLFSDGLEAVFYDGMIIGKELTLKAAAGLRTVRENRIRADSVPYNLLLNADLYKLLQSYDLRYDAAQNLMKVDYAMPTVNRNVNGISGVLHMLTELETENRFVGTFDAAERQTLFERWHRELATPGAECVNLGKLCFMTAILSLLAGRDEPSLVMGPADIASLTTLGCTGDQPYYAALNVLHRLNERAPERYLMLLLKNSRAELTQLFRGGEKALRYFIRTEN